MATGDVVVFNEALEYMFDGGWEPADAIWCAVLDDTVDPAQADTTPALADYTEVGTGGTYSAGGELLDTWGNMCTVAAAVMTFDDTGANVAWTQDGGNDVDAYWGFVYNYTEAADPGIAFIELGGPVNMQAGALQITWHANGIFTVTNP